MKLVNSRFFHSYLCKFAGSEWNYLKAVAKETGRPVSECLRLCVLINMGRAVESDFVNRDYTFPTE